MWQRFTDRARKVILLGQEEARRFGSPSVGTEHLLLGLVREQEGTAAHVLEQMGVQLEAMRGEVEKVSPPVDAPRGEPNLSPRVKRVLELAADEAHHLRSNHIGTEHLLLALLREKDGVAAKVLRGLGVDLDNARNLVRDHIVEPGLENRFTDRARKVISLAQEMARKASSPTVGTEHLLLGLVFDAGGVAAQVLERMGVTLAQVSAEIERLSPATSESSHAAPSFGPEFKRVLELAADEARSMRFNYIGTEHLLPALLCVSEGIAAKVLANLGLRLEEVRATILEFLGPEAAVPPPPHLVTGGAEPNIRPSFRRFKTILDELSQDLDGERRDRLNELQLLFENAATDFLTASGASHGFERAARDALSCARWYQQRALSVADYRLAADLRGRIAVLEGLIAEMRALFGESAPPEE